VTAELCEKCSHLEVREPEDQPSEIHWTTRFTVAECSTNPELAVTVIL